MSRWKRSTHLALLVVAAAACEKAAPDAPRTTAVSSHAAQTAQTSAIDRSALTITHGSIDTQGDVLAIRDPEVRAVVPSSGSDEATLSFTYLGPTDKSAPLASGTIRRQVGLKLRANDGCNLVYVMWRFEPKAELVVSVKENPGERTHAECGARGYRNVAADAPLALPPVISGAKHTLHARVDGERLSVSIDGSTPVSYALGPSIAKLHGPVGFRTDNAKCDLQLFAPLGAAPSGEATLDDE
jgi:hypothetical protein